MRRVGSLISKDTVTFGSARTLQQGNLGPGCRGQSIISKEHMEEGHGKRDDVEEARSRKEEVLATYKQIKRGRRN